MKNELVDLGVDMFNAIAALRLKRHQLRSTPEGVEILQPGRPRLLLTYQAAKDFVDEVEEAENS